jgi:hypothetical protein
MLTKDRVRQVVRGRAELIDRVPGDAQFHKGYVAAFVTAAMEAGVVTALDAQTLYRKAEVHD